MVHGIHEKRGKIIWGIGMDDRNQNAVSSVPFVVLKSLSTKD